MARLLLLKDLRSIKSISTILSKIPAREKVTGPLLIKPNYSSDHLTDAVVDSNVFKILSRIYAASESIIPLEDTRVLLPSSKTTASQTDEIFTDCKSIANEHNAVFITVEHIEGIPDCSAARIDNKRYNSTCLGGTFDRLHVAHKILISEALLLARKRIVVGIASGPLLEKKLLKELIEPIDKRVDAVKLFIDSVQSHLDRIDVVGITDPVGPAGTDPDLECIVVSEEVRAAIPSINAGRTKLGLKELLFHVHNDGKMLESGHKDSDDQITGDVSSSAGRAKLLGTLLSPPVKEYSPDAPYIIGLTGPIASGKTSVAKRLEKLGAYRLDADKLGHLAYVPETSEHREGPAYKPVLDHFGRDILCDDSNFIDRKKLGAKVFGNPEERKKLEHLVWPAIQELAEESIQKAFSSGSKIVVLEAAVLLEAGWNSFVNEVWSTYVPAEESVARCVARDGKSEDAVRNIIAVQVNLSERVESSNVVISTVWESTVTQRYCEKAWGLLLNRLQ